MEMESPTKAAEKEAQEKADKEAGELGKEGADVKAGETKGEDDAAKEELQQD